MDYNKQANLEKHDLVSLFLRDYKEAVPDRIMAESSYRRQVGYELETFDEEPVI